MGAFSTAPYMRPAPKGGAAYTALIRDDCAQAKTPEKGEYVCQLQCSVDGVVENPHDLFGLLRYGHGGGVDFL